MSIQILFGNLLTIAIFMAFIAMVASYFIESKNKNYAKTKMFGMIYIFLNVLRLLLEHFNVF